MNKMIKEIGRKGYSYVRATDQKMCVCSKTENSGCPGEVEELSLLLFSLQKRQGTAYWQAELDSERAIFPCLFLFTPSLNNSVSPSLQYKALSFKSSFSS